MQILRLLILSCLLLPGVIVAQQTGTRSADEIVQRVIARRADAHRQAGPFTAILQTRSTIDITSLGPASLLLPSQTVVQESMGNLHRDEGQIWVRIFGRRGTVLKPGIARNLIENFRSLAGYVGVDDDEIVLLNTSFPSPLGQRSTRYYSYELIGERSYKGVPVYQIAIRPATDLHPAFEGMLIVERTKLDLLSIELSPSGATALPFIDSLHLVETFHSVGSGIHQPLSFELNGTGTIGAVTFGLAEPAVTFSMRGELKGWEGNHPIPDSILAQSERLIIDDDADRAPESFWRGRSMLSDAEVGSIQVSRLRARPAPVRFAATPSIDYNRAGAVTLALGGQMTYDPVTLGMTGGYSFGLERPIGDASLAVELGDEDGLHGALRGRAFSELATTTVGDKSYPRIMNTLVAASLHQDYYNFMRKDGWSVRGELAYAPMKLTATFEQSRQFSVGNNARWALLTWNGKEFQPNPSITDGRYQTVQVELARQRVVPFLKITPVDEFDLRWSITGLLGKRTDSAADFKLAEALVSLSFPTIRTGYNPMTLTLLGAAGIGTSSLPPQYQFRLRTSAASFGKPGGFVSPPKGLYGGTEYIAVGAEFNTSDLWWRAIGLPTWKGRGVELIVAGGGARYEQAHPTGYSGTGDLWYTEAGIALSRIPLFITELIYGRVDLRQGLGPLGKFGFNFTFVAPM